MLGFAAFQIGRSRQRCEKWGFGPGICRQQALKATPVSFGFGPRSASFPSAQDTGLPRRLSTDDTSLRPSLTWLETVPIRPSLLWRSSTGEEAHPTRSPRTSTPRLVVAPSPPRRPSSCPPLPSGLPASADIPASGILLPLPRHQIPFGLQSRSSSAPRPAPNSERYPPDRTAKDDLLALAAAPAFENLPGRRDGETPRKARPRSRDHSTRRRWEYGHNDVHQRFPFETDLPDPFCFLISPPCRFHLIPLSTVPRSPPAVLCPTDT